MAERVSLDVIATKITPPRLGVPLITRPRLLNQIAGAEGYRLLLLSAEAGYGKTSLLLSLRSQLDVPVAWLTLDETDANPSLLAVGLVSALRRVVPGFGENILRVLTAGPGVDALKTQLSRAFQDLPPLLIVLDDLQVIDGDPDATALVDHLLVTLPSPVRVAAAGRVWPRLQSLPSLLVAGHVVVLDKTALAFTGEETATFLRESHGMAVEADHAQHLSRRTEGWAAALQLTALALKRRRAESLEGTPREIFEYLAVAVLQHLPEAEQAFLLRTSILSELSPVLCAAVAERGDAAEVLATLDRANLFLYRLDDAGTRFRYHQLFAEFLQQQLARQGADAVAALHQRAARQLEAEGAPERAIRHYIAAGAPTDAERVMKPLHGNRLTARLAYVLRDIVSRLPAEILQQHPWIARCGASSCRFVGDYKLGLAFARKALAASESTDLDLWAFSIHGVGVMLVHLDQCDEAVTVCRMGLRRLDDLSTGAAASVEPRMYRGILTVLIEALIQLGRVDEAEIVVARLPALPVAGTQPGKGMGEPLWAGLIANLRMEYRRAAGHLRDALRLTEASGSLTWQTWVSVEQLRVEVAGGSATSAMAALRRAQDLQAQTGERDHDLMLSYLAGDAHLLSGRLDAAAAAYGETLTRVGESESEEPKVWAMLGRARLERTRGHLREAESLLAAALQIIERTNLGKVRPQVQLEQALVRASSAQPGAAVGPLREAHDIYTRWQSQPGLVKTRLLGAHLGLHGVGPTLIPDPLEHLAGLLHDADSVRDDLRVFLAREAAWLAPLCIEALRRRVGSEILEPLLTGMGDAATGALVAALADPQLAVRAVRLLGRIGDPKARRPLTQVRPVNDPELRRVVREALGVLREPSPAVLRVTLLGAFEAWLGERRLSEDAWRTQKVKGLLKYLLLHRHRPVMRDEAIEALWPEANQKAGADNLKTALKHLRHALEPDLEGARSHFIVREGDALRVASDAPCQVDVDEYDRLVAAGRRHASEGNATDAIAALAEAVAAYRGDLLDDDRNADWAIGERERRRELHLETLGTLANLHARRGEYAPALELLQTVIRLDRLREPAYRDLMRFAIAQGDRGRALRAYRACEEALREDLGIAPQPETVSLLQQVQSQV